MDDPNNTSGTEADEEILTYTVSDEALEAAGRHIVVLCERTLREYARHYNTARTHQSLEQDAPISRSVQQMDASCRTPCLAGCITNTSESRFSARTG
jgi:hypothetical protein